MNPAVIRIVLRYAAAALVTYGVLAPPEAALLVDDPQLVTDLAAVAGTIMAASVEGFYWLAKRLGWRT